MSELLPARRSHLLAALFVVYVVWGSTYLGMRIAVRTMPPLLMCGTRFLAAGLVLFGWCWWQRRRHPERHWSPPTLAQWRSGAIVGLALPAAGTGGVSWAEQRLPSGLGALLMATIPVWITVAVAVVDRERITLVVASGLLLGLIGVAVLADPFGGASAPPMAPVLVALAGAAAWGCGSAYSRHAPRPDQPLLASSVEMLCAGSALVLVGAAGGELHRVHLPGITLESVLALVYLTIFGSLLAYSTYEWLLAHAPARLVGTYAFANPLVAVLLGWAVLDETLSVRTVLATGLIVAGVAFLVLRTRPAHDS